MDPLCCYGSCEDGPGLLLGHQAGYYGFGKLAACLGAGLKKALTGCSRTWRRLRVQLDDMRSRTLPHPWTWVWTEQDNASMLVRNHTKVALRVELHVPRGAAPSPLRDSPLLKGLYRSVATQLLQRLGRKAVEDWPSWVPGSKQRPVLIGHVKPHFEWALKPAARLGRHFEMRLVTEAGVVVCARRMKRGETYDFQISVPEPPPHFASVSRAKAPHDPARAEDQATTDSVHEPPGSENAPEDALEAKWKYQGLSAQATLGKRFLGADANPAGVEADGSESVCSTAAPSTTAATATAMSSTPAGTQRGSLQSRSSLGSLHAQALAHQRQLCQSQTLQQQKQHQPSELPEPEAESMLEIDDVALAVEADDEDLDDRQTMPVPLSHALCPRCLRQMAARSTRPLSSIYAKGVRCDRCEATLLTRSKGLRQAGHPCFFHCSRCWFDMCRHCALQEMRDVWWGSTE